jgi:hypothetical protein
VNWVPDNVLTPSIVRLSCRNGPSKQTCYSSATEGHFRKLSKTYVCLPCMPWRLVRRDIKAGPKASLSRQTHSPSSVRSQLGCLLSQDNAYWPSMSRSRFESTATMVQPAAPNLLPGSLNVSVPCLFGSVFRLLRYRQLGMVGTSSDLYPRTVLVRAMGSSSKNCNHIH